MEALNPRGGSRFEEYWKQAKGLFKDFAKFATGLTAEVGRNAQQLAPSLGRPFAYLNNRFIYKEKEAQKTVFGRHQAHHGKPG